MPRLALPLCALLLAALASAPAAAQTVRRCLNAQGNVVYTDRPCSAVDSVPNPGRPGGPETVGNTGALEGFQGNFGSGFATLGCSRRARELLDGVRGALEARDVNRLASFYHWTGTGAGAATHLMDRLEDIAGRGVVAADLLYADGSIVPPPAPPDSPGDAGSGGYPPALDEDGKPLPRASEAPRDPGPDEPFPLSAPGEASPPPPDARPARLRVEQAGGPGDAGAYASEFRLVRNAGCWWIEL